MKDTNLLSDYSSAPPPPMSEELERELRELKPVKLRRPRRDYALVLTAAALYGAALVLITGIRRDLDVLPRWWVISMLSSWVLAYAVVAWVALVPPRGRVMPRWSLCALAIGLAGLGFTALGLLLPRAVPGVSVLYELDAASFFHHAKPCLRLGLISAIVPLALGVILVRGAARSGSRWIAGALGAAGGLLGGVVLHLHCPIAERFHVGLVHGGVVLIAAALAAVLVRPAR